MKLDIGERTGCHAEKDTYFLSIDSLKYAQTHMFIASNKWDSVHIQMQSNMQSEALRYIPMVTDEIEVDLPEKITMDIVGTLAALYPKKSGELRRAFMSGKDVKEVLAC